MAIQMTRAEYQSKYGTQPNTQPIQPIKMTALEYKSKYGQEPSSQEPSLVEKVANVAPAVGGTIGGVAGGILGGTAGSVVPGAGTAAGGIVGSGAGTALGTFGGNVVKNSILDLFNKQRKTPIEQLGQATKESAVAGAVDVGTGAVLKGAGKILKPVAKSIGKVVEDIPLKSVRVNPSQITNWGKAHKQDLSKWMVDKKILGENAIDIAERSVDQLQQQFDNLAMNENITIPVNKLRQRFSKEIANLAGVKNGVKTGLVPEINEDIAKKVLRAWGYLDKQISQMGVQDVTPKMLTEYRRILDNVIPKSAWVNPSVKNTALRLRGMLNEVVQEGVDARLIGPGEKGSLKALGKELSKYYDFLEIASKQENLGRGSLLANLPRILISGGAGTVGALLGRVPGAVAGTTLGLAGEAALRSPEVLKSIYQTGLFARRTLPKVSKVGTSIFQRIPSAISTLSQ